jgi:asparagine synthase (glutamine-hydrolysing)
MSEAGLNAEGIFNVEIVRSLWTEFLGGSDRAYYLVWNVLMFQAWLRRWCGTPVANPSTKRTSSLVN